MTRRPAVTIVKPPITWILVADGREAQIYRRQHLEKLIPLERESKHSQFEEVIANGPVPVPGMKWKAESVDQYDIQPDQLGRVQENASCARHMSEPRMDVYEEVKAHFANLIAEKLTRAREEKSFDRLVLIAPAKMLGEIKKHLNAKVLKCVAAEMSKDLTSRNGQTLTKYLGSIA
jgi:protein required for attachment to host cells